MESSNPMPLGLFLSVFMPAAMLPCLGSQFYLSVTGDLDSMFIWTSGFGFAGMAIFLGYHIRVMVHGRGGHQGGRV